MLAQLTSQLVLTLLVEPHVCLDSIYQELTVPLAHHHQQFALQLLSSKFVQVCIILLQLLETKFHVPLAQLLETLLTVIMLPLQPVVSLEIVQLTEFVPYAQPTLTLVQDLPFSLVYLDSI